MEDGGSRRVVLAGAGRGDGGHRKTACAAVRPWLSFRLLRSRIPKSVCRSHHPAKAWAPPRSRSPASRALHGGRDTGQLVILDEEVDRMAERVSRQDQSGGAVSGMGGVERRCTFVVNRSLTREVRRLPFEQHHFTQEEQGQSNQAEPEGLTVLEHFDGRHHILDIRREYLGLAPSCGDEGLPPILRIEVSSCWHGQVDPMAITTRWCPHRDKGCRTILVPRPGEGRRGCRPGWPGRTGVRCAAFSPLDAQSVRCGGGGKQEVLVLPGVKLLDPGRPGGFAMRRAMGTSRALGEVGPLGGQRSCSPVEPPLFVQAGREEGTPSEKDRRRRSRVRVCARVPPSGRQVDPPAWPNTPPKSGCS